MLILGWLGLIGLILFLLLLLALFERFLDHVAGIGFAVDGLGGLFLLLLIRFVGLGVLVLLVVRVLVGL